MICPLNCALSLSFFSTVQQLSPGQKLNDDDEIIIFFWIGTFFLSVALIGFLPDFKNPFWTLLMKPNSSSCSFFQVKRPFLLLIFPPASYFIPPCATQLPTRSFFFYMIFFFPHSYVTAYSPQHQSLQDLSLSDGADIYICPLSMEEEWS